MEFEIYQLHSSKKWYVVEVNSIDSKTAYLFNPKLHWSLNLKESFIDNVMIDNFNGKFDNCNWFMFERVVCFDNKEDAKKALEWVESVRMIKKLKECN